MAETIPCKPPRNGHDAERRAVCWEALELAKRAEAAGLARAAYLLDLAALHAANACGLFATSAQPPVSDARQMLADDPIPDEPESLIAWARRHIFTGDE
jgi:hypothetical protein